jgi:hypothetical protein
MPPPSSLSETLGDFSGLLERRAHDRSVIDQEVSIMKIALVLAPLALAAMVAALGAAAASEAEAAKPYGSYTVRLAPKDPDVPAGVWRLTLRPGRYTLLSEAFPIPNGGRLSVSGNVLTFSRETLCQSAVGRYRWRLSDGRLRLRLIGTDTCSGNDRTVVLTSKLWTKRPS